MGSPDPSKKVVAQHLARLLARSECRELLESMRDLGLFDPEDGPPASGAPTVDLRVGIWKPEQRDGRTSFVRAPPADSWPGAWCDVEVIPPKRGRRVLLLGESTARGLHYDPFHTPAMVLQHFLRATPGCEDCEVVDLARTDGTIDYLSRTLPRSLQLDPDVIVVFAGNNWKADLMYASTANRYRRLEQARGCADRTVHEDDLLRAAVRDYVDLVDRCMELAGIPIVHVLPEFNLCDWEPTFVGSCPLLPDDRNVRWHEQLVQLQQASQEGDEGAIEARAKALMELDGGLGSAGPFALGQLYRRQGRSEEARDWLEQAADRGTTVPRCSRAVQGELRAAAQKGDLALVDLPRCFAEQHQGALPDRRLFLDYCHLTVDGIQLAMRLVASALLPQLGAGPEAVAMLERTELRPDPYVEACGSLCGALYNGRFHQGYEIVRHHCQAALERAPEILGDIHAFLDHNASGLSKGLHVSYLAGVGTPLHAIQKRLSIPKANWTVIRALREAMTDVDPKSAERVDALLRRDFDVTQPGGMDVLGSHFWSRRGQARQQGAMYHCCYESMLLVEIFAAEQVALELDLTLRAGADARDEEIVVAINGVELTRVCLCSSWQRVRAPISTNSLRCGVNVVQIEWPAAGLASRRGHHRPVWGMVAAMRLEPADPGPR